VGDIALTYYVPFSHNPSYIQSKAGIIHFQRRQIVKCALITTFILSIIILAACGGSTTPASEAEVMGEVVSVDSGTYTNISVPELQTMLDTKDFVFVNVHIPFAGDIPNTDLSIPFDQMDANLDQLPEGKDAKIVLYCRSGSMSSTAAKTLVELGYSNVLNLEGGFNAWKAAGLPLEGN
jgi:rhodanese-related sulfurtransferase